MKPFKYHPSAVSWEKVCDALTERCWPRMSSTNAAGMITVMGDVDRCAHLRFMSLDAAQASCIQRGAQCTAISMDSGLPCDYLLGATEFLLGAPDKESVDRSVACLRGRWPPSDGFPDFSTTVLKKG